jgi:hypothetical protein
MRGCAVLQVLEVQWGKKGIRVRLDLPVPLVKKDLGEQKDLWVPLVRWVCRGKRV